MQSRYRRVFQPMHLVVCLAVLSSLPGRAWAWTCAAADLAAMTAAPGCVHGAPVRSGDLILVPRICRVVMGAKSLDRHTVDLRNAATGARVGQASLAPVDVVAGARMPAVANVLGGPLPLLLHGAGIGAIDTKSGHIESVFDSETGLLAVARAGEVLAIVEKMPPDKHFPKGGVEWTVLDYGSGELLGQLQVAGPDAEGVELRATAGKGLETTLLRRVGAKWVALVAVVRDQAGKNLAVDGALSAKLREAAAPTPVSGTGCAVLAAAQALRADLPAFAVSEDPARGSAAAAASKVPVSATAACLALIEPDARGESFGWFAPAQGKAELRAVHCSNGN